MGERTESGAGHPYAPDASFDGGDLDCGSGLLLLIRRHIDPLARGQLLEIRSTESSVREDLPAWCRLTGNELVSELHHGRSGSYLVCKGPFQPSAAASAAPQNFSSYGRATPFAHTDGEPGEPKVAAVAAASAWALSAPTIRPLSVMGVGSWPRPRWMQQALHDYHERRLAADAFQETADDAVRLCVEAQLRAGVDVLTDGEQRRDNYASFVGALLDNCQLIPITDLLPYVDDPERFKEELRALDVPAERVRHPAVFGRLARSRPLALSELQFVRGLSDLPVKIALPGPYLLTRTMWMECISDRAYATREDLAEDIVRVLREELDCLLAAGAAMVQFDEPVLSEVVFGRPSAQRTFMCGALGPRRSPAEELEFAESLINRVVEGMPTERIALHVCRGNWSPDERVALAGDYRPLVGLFSRVKAGTLILEACTARAGEIDVLSQLPEDRRIGVGVVNQKLLPSPTLAEEVLARAERAVARFGPDRVLLNPDCGFATFADNPIVPPAAAERQLAAIAQAARLLRRKYHLD